MNKFNVRFRDMELRSCEDMTTLAEIVLWRKSKTDFGEYPVVLANWNIGERTHYLQVLPNTFYVDDAYDQEIFRKLVKTLAYIVRNYLLDEDEELNVKQVDGSDDLNLSQDLSADGEDDD